MWLNLNEKVTGDADAWIGAAAAVAVGNNWVDGGGDAAADRVAAPAGDGSWLCSRNPSPRPECWNEDSGRCRTASR